MVWATEWAPTRAELDSCVDCGLCLPHCPTFRLTGDETASPRGRINAMRAVAAGTVALDDDFAEVMGFCLQCRACEAACPSLVPFGRAMEGARAEVAAALPSRLRRLRSRILGRWLASRRSVGLATRLAALGQRLGAGAWLPGRLRSGLKGLRRLPWRVPSLQGRVFEPQGAPVGTAALLAGCVMDPWFQGVHEATVEVLRRAGYRVEVPESQTCCGALAAHDGAAAEAATLAVRNVDAFRGYDVVVVDSAGCGAHLKDYRHWAADGGELAARVRDVTEVVAEAIESGRLPPSAGKRGRVAMQDPCHLRHAQRVTAQPRRIVEAAGYEVVEVDPVGLCCGAAGVYSVLRPDTSAELGRQKADQVRSTGASVVVSANPGCEMQLRAHLGDEVRIVHPIELYREALAEPV